MYEIRYTKEAAKSLRNVRELIEAKLHEYAAAPEQGRNVIKLEGRPGYRMRIGDWRGVFEVDNGALAIMVIKVAPRGEVYKR